MKSYHELLRDVLENGETHDDRTGVGTRSVFGRQWRHDMRNGFPLLTTKKVALRWVAEELFWFLSGSTNEADLRSKGVDIWKEWATEEQTARFMRDEGDLGPVYGALWRHYPIGAFDAIDNGNGSSDQIAAVVQQIVNTPNSRRIICTGWHPHYATRVALPPCHTIWQVKCHHNGDLSLHLYARSIDIFLGLPFNIASYALLLSLLGRATDRSVRDLIISFGDLHLYNNHVDQAGLQLSREPYPLPRLTLRAPDGEDRLQKLLSFTWDHVQLNGYQHHPKIEAEVAV